MKWIRLLFSFSYHRDNGNLAGSLFLINFCYFLLRSCRENAAKFKHTICTVRYFRTHYLVIKLKERHTHESNAILSTELYIHCICIGQCKHTLSFTILLFLLDLSGALHSCTPDTALMEWIKRFPLPAIVFERVSQARDVWATDSVRRTSGNSSQAAVKIDIVIYIYLESIPSSLPFLRPRCHSVVSFGHFVQVGAGVSICDFVLDSFSDMYSQRN